MKICNEEYTKEELKKKNLIVVFNYRQYMFIIWVINHIPFATFYKRVSGMLTDPFTDNDLAVCFYYDSPDWLAVLLDTIVQILKDSTAKENEDKCIKYGLLSRVKK